MKKLATLLGAFACVSASFAQELSFPSESIVSPQIHADGRVSFRMKGIDVKSVKITGDFLPVGRINTPYGEMDTPGYADMVKKDGFWEYTTPEPLSPELYTYSFVVDSVNFADPSNIYAVRNVESLGSTFMVPGEESALYEINKVPHGTVAKRWYSSPSLGMERRLTVYTPAGYEKSNESYPVLYLLHGMGGDEESWITVGRAAQILDNLIAQGKAKPMIVVMPNGNVAQEAAPGESSNGFEKPTMNLPHTLDGKMEETFPDIMKFIESNYRTIESKSGRAIAGLSMGGMHSLDISRQYPNLFDYVGLFSALTRPIQKVDSPIFQDVEKKLATQFACPPKLYWIGIGKTDFLYKLNQIYRKELDAKKYPYTYFESEGGHIWKNWRAYLSEFVPLIFK